MKFDNQIYYFIYNKMNTLRIVLNQQKQVVKILKYDNNGKIVGDTNKKLKVDFSYAGGLLEPLSGLLFFEEGVFNPKRGKWISQIENDDIIENLKKLSQLPSTDVYECSDTLDTYYHSYLCTNGRCGGFYAINYMSYLDGLGTMSDNSKYFHLKRCNKVNISTNLFNTKKFSQCIENEIQSKEIQRFDFLTDNCHHKVSEILNQCKSVSQKEEM